MALRASLRAGRSLNDSELAVQREFGISRYRMVELSLALESMLDEAPRIDRFRLHRATAFTKKTVRRVLPEALANVIRTIRRTDPDIADAIKAKTQALRHQFGILDLDDSHAIRSLLLQGIAADAAARKDQ